MAEVTRTTQAGFSVLGVTDSDVRTTQTGFVVIGGAVTASPVRATQAGFTVVAGNLRPQAPSLSVVPLAASFSATTTAFNPSAGYPADVHLSTEWEIAATTDPTFSAPLFTYTYEAPSPYLISAVLDGLAGATTYLVRARHEGTYGFSMWSNVVEATTQAAHAIADAPTLTFLDVDTDRVEVRTSVFTHPDGQTTFSAFDPLAPLPYLEFADFQIRVKASGVVIVDTGPVPPASETYGEYLDTDLSDDTTYEIRARLWDGYHNAAGTWGTWVEFSTLAIPPIRPDAPALTVTNNEPKLVNVVSAAFSHPEGGATHQATRWRARTGTSDVGVEIVTTNPAQLLAYAWEDLPDGGPWVFDVAHQDDSDRWSAYGATDTATQWKRPEPPDFLYLGGVRLCSSSRIRWTMPDGLAIAWHFYGGLSADGGETWANVFGPRTAENWWFSFSGRPDGLYILRVRASHPDALYWGDYAYLTIRVDRTCDKTVYYDFSKITELDPEWEVLWNNVHSEWRTCNLEGEAGSGFGILATSTETETVQQVRTCLVFPELGQPTVYEAEISFCIFGNQNVTWWWRWLEMWYLRGGLGYAISGYSEDDTAEWGNPAAWTRGGLTHTMTPGRPLWMPYAAANCDDEPDPFCFGDLCIQATACQCTSVIRQWGLVKSLFPGSLVQYGVPPEPAKALQQWFRPGSPWERDFDILTVPWAGAKIRGALVSIRKTPAPACSHRHYKYTMHQKVERTVTGGIRVRSKFTGPGLDPEAGWTVDQELSRQDREDVGCGYVGLALDFLKRSLAPEIGIVFTSFMISGREYDTCEPPPDFEPSPDLPEGLTVGRPCVVILEVYEEDRKTIKWQVGDYREHPHPFLCLLENYGEQEVDPVSGAVTIGQVEVVVVDRRQIAGDQDTGWLTERLGVSTVGAIHGRRCRVLRYISEALGWVVIADGPASTPKMDSSYSAFRWVVKDTRETERKVKAFVKANTSTLLPMGVEPGFGAYIDEDGAAAWLVDPAAPLVGTYSYDPLDPLKPFPVGTVEFQDYWSGGFGHGGAPIGDQVIDEAVVITAPVEKAFLADAEELGDPRPVLWTWPQLEIVWRLLGSSDPWNVVQPTDLLPAGRTTAKPTGAGQWWRSLITPWDAELADGTEVRGALYMTLRGYGATGTFPTDGDEIELLIRYTGEPTEDFPLHLEGMTSGEFLKKLYDGEYSPPDPITGDVAPTAIRYNETDLLRMGGGVSFVSLGTGLGNIGLASGGILLLETATTAVDRIRLRQTEVVDDLRSWAEEHVYAPTGWFPALNNDGEISPRNQVPPTDFSQLLQIYNAVTEPQPDWDAGERIVNVLTYLYPRWIVAEVGDIEAVDRLMERGITQEYRDEASITRHAIQQVTYEGDVFSALGDVGGQPIVGGTAQEQSTELANLRKLYVFDRYRNGAPIIQVPVMRRHCSLIRAGDWVVIDLSWFPDYVTKERGLITGAQVLAVYDVDCAWRILLLEEAFPITEES